MKSKTESGLPTRLKRIREQKGIPQRVMAEKMGTTLRLYQGYEGGKTNPGFHKVEVLAKAFPEINATWLLTGDGPMLMGETAPQAAPATEKKVEITAQELALEIAKFVRSRKVELCSEVDEHDVLFQAFLGIKGAREGLNSWIVRSLAHLGD